MENPELFRPVPHAVRELTGELRRQDADEPKLE